MTPMSNEASPKSTSGIFEKARADLTEVINNPAEDRVGLEAYWERADVRSMQGDLAGAIADATAVLSAIGWRADMPPNTIVTSLLLGGFEWSSLATDALLTRGEAYRRVGELDKALADLTWIIEHDLIADNPIIPQASGLRGLVYSALGKDDLAKQDFAICRDDDPEYYESKIKPELTKLLNNQKPKTMR